MGVPIYTPGLRTPIAVIEGGTPLNEVFAAECDAVEAEVRALTDRGIVRYVHLSDLHAGTTLDEDRRLCLAALAEMVKRLALDFVLLTGDIIAGTGGDAQAQQEVLLEIKNIFSECGVPVIVCRGNHDDNSVLDSTTGMPVPENVVTNAWWNWYMGTAFGRASNQYIAPVGENGYFYVDLPHKKIRIININCSDLTEAERLETGGQNWLKVSAEQLDWLSNTAFAVEDGWKVICASHMVPVDGMAIGGKITNSAELYAALEANADKVIAYNAGHIHISANYVDDKGLRFITANASGGRVVAMSECREGYGFSGVSAEARAAAPTGAMVFDICIVNHDYTVSRVRFGAKDDMFKDTAE